MLCRLRGDGGIPGGQAGWRCTITVVRAYVGVTDNNWYQFLADRPGVTEVNFWQPSGAREFRVLAPGEPFFFKTPLPPQPAGRRRLLQRLGDDGGCA